MPKFRRWPVAAEALDIVMRQRGCDAATAAAVLQDIAARDKVTLEEASSAIVARERQAARDAESSTENGS